MITIVAMVIKEFVVLYRDKWGLFGIFLFPLLMALFIGIIPYPNASNANNTEMPKIYITVIDKDQTPLSQFYIRHLQKNTSLKIQVAQTDALKKNFNQKNLYCYLIFKQQFGQQDTLDLGKSPTIECQIVKPELNAKGYIRKTLSEIFLKFLNIKYSGKEQNALAFQPPKFQEKIQHIGDQKPYSSFEISFPLAILWSIMASTGIFSFSIVVERTAGTLSRLRLILRSLVQLLVAKAVACFLVLLMTSIFFILLGFFAFDIRIHNVFHLILAVLSTALGFVGIMMFISVLGKTEQTVGAWGQAILLIMMMTGGGMLPLVFMPRWMHILSNLSPVKWGIFALEGAMWRQFSFHEMLFPCAVLSIIGSMSFLIGSLILIKAKP